MKLQLLAPRPGGLRPSASPDRRGRRLSSLGWLSAIVLGFAGCDGGDGSDPKDSAPTSDAVADATDLDIDAATDTALDTIEAEVDAATDVGTSDGDEVDADAATDAIDSPEADGVGSDSADVGPECAADADCTGKLTLLACQVARCEAGACKASTANGKCCANADCEDGNECTVGACDLGKQTCLQTPIPNCCSGKLSLLDQGFEAGIGDLQVALGPTNGNVGWQASTARARVGAQSLYFGNACATYDTTMTPDGGCQAGDGAAAVSGSLTSKPVALPKDKSIQLHFWLWLEAEPMYDDTLPKGTCNPACGLGSSCVAVNGTSQCLAEKDVLTVQVIPDGASPIKLFDSTAIDKSTGGAWHRVVLDLDSFQGKSVRLQWQFQSTNGFKNQFEGLYLDELVVETVCAVEGTLCGPTQKCKDDGNVCTVDACTLYGNAVSKGFCFHDTKEGCCLLDSHCDDGKPCTMDTCKAGICQHNPDGGKAECCKPSVTANHDFDSGTLSGWTQLDGNSSDVGWKIDPKGGAKGSQALYFGDNAFASYQDPSLGAGVGPKATICAPPTKLKVGTLYNLLTFQLQLETEWSYLAKGSYKNPPVLGQPKFDHLAAGVREEGVPGAKIVPVWSSDVIAGSTEGAWLEVTVALDAWQGKDISVCFSFDAGDDQVNDRAGVHLDDVLIKVACSKPECLVDAECTKLSCGACQTPGCAAGVCGCLKVPGCCATNADCDDSNACTGDTCKDNACGHVPLPGCCTADTDCKASDPCQAATCDAAVKQCKVAAVAGCCKVDKDCDKGLLCVTPTCKANVCVEAPIAGCCKADADCDDKVPCTDDQCIDLKCSHAQKPGCP